MLTHNRQDSDRSLGDRPFRSKQKPPAMSWVISKKLAVGAAPTLQTLPELAKHGIQVLVSLCAETEARLPDEVQQHFECVRLVLPDSHCAEQLTPDQLAKAVALLHHPIANQRTVFVHCLAGIERSPTVCIAYLCQHHQFELWEATKWLKQVHPRSMPTNAQMQVLREYVEEYSS
ncbi:MAG: dual specificity protein phosphatase family protein [Leptolyngbyaceae cyanobacterium RU_5_1]|nr:dual specificity protein phosphatase family protein [Leptolyngbyaceae cyanobacterium RU_5_1]